MTTEATDTTSTHTRDPAAPEREDTRTPELLVDFIATLDGFAGSDGWPGWWGLEGPEYLSWLETQPEGAYPMLMGASTYRMFARFTEGYEAAGATGTGDEEQTVTGIAAAPKVVVSSTLEAATMPNTRLLRGDATEVVAQLKRPGGTSLRTVGSLSLCRSLLAAGLVDRLRVTFFPVITGRTGFEPIFAGYPDVGLELRETRTLDGRTQVLDYVPTVLPGPPSAADSPR